MGLEVTERNMLWHLKDWGLRSGFSQVKQKKKRFSQDYVGEKNNTSQEDIKRADENIKVKTWE